MDFTIAKAAQAYAKTLSGAVEGDTAATGAAGGTSFADMVEQAAGQSIAAERAGETASVKALGNGANLTDVVAAVNNAEVTLQTVVAVRDRVIGAYQDIIKMPI